jgi:hypothetical protein
MDKLQQILVYRFWISLGLALVLPVVGWYLATNDLAASTKSRMKKVKGAFKTVDGIKQAAPTTPNEHWESGLKDVNNQRSTEYAKAVAALQRSQDGLMTWPAEVQEKMKVVEYGKVPDQGVRFDYKLVYDNEVKRIVSILDPFDPSKEKDNGRIQVPVTPLSLPIRVGGSWPSLGPSETAMWEAQEDLWFMQTIFEAIANVNAAMPRINEVPIPVLERLTFHGGNLAKRGGRGAIKSKGKKSARSLRNQSSVFTNALGFKAIDEFGPASKLEETGGRRGGDDEDSRGGFRRRGQGAVDANQKRYIENSDNLPYKTRGFILRVVMDHTKIPELVAELTDLPWAVRIYRVQYSDEAKPQYIAAQSVTNETKGRSTGTRFGRREETDDGASGGVQAKDSPQKRLFDAAVSNASMATVIVAGTMTVYKQPKSKSNDSAKPAAPAGGQLATQPPAATENPGELKSKPGGPTTKSSDPDGQPQVSADSDKQQPPNEDPGAPTQQQDSSSPEPTEPEAESKEPEAEPKEPQAEPTEPEAESKESET